MEITIEKCVMILKRGEKKKNQECIRIVGEKEKSKFLEILEADTIKQTEMKEKK